VAPEFVVGEFNLYEQQFGVPKRSDFDVHRTVLRKAAETDEHIRDMLSFFEKDLTDVTAVAQDFFSKYDEVCADIDFIQDFGLFFMMFKERVVREENILFLEYERLKK
jgi:hypothetical protein